MELTGPELIEAERRKKALGIIPQNATLTRVHLSLAPGASRAGALAESERIDVAVSDGRSRPLDFGGLRLKRSDGSKTSDE